MKLGHMKIHTEIENMSIGTCKNKGLIRPYEQSPFKAEYKRGWRPYKAGNNAWVGSESKPYEAEAQMAFMMGLGNLEDMPKWLESRI